MQRPQSTWGLIRRLIRLRWAKLGPRGRTGATVAFLVLALSTLAMAGSCMLRSSCFFGGCPYQGQGQSLSAPTTVAPDFEHPAIEASEIDEESGEHGCAFSNR